MSYAVRNIGTVATLLPQMKRAIGRHTDGRSLAFFPDTNLATSNGADVTGTAKFTVYASSDSNRTAWSKLLDFAPTQAGSSSTQKFVGSMAVNSDNDIFIAYQGTDNSLRLVTLNWNGTSYDAAVSQTVVAANAVTNRYRAIDIDVSNATSGTPAIIVYEADASSGQGAHLRVYIRLDDSTTWRKAYEVTLQTTGFIKSGSEDVSVSWGADGIVTNVGRLALYWTVTSTTADSGDVLREISFNTNTGTDNSATVVGSWDSTLNRNVASGTRRGWLFKNKTISSAACWVFGGVIGQSIPFYMGAKLHHNSFTYTLNRTVNSLSETTSPKFRIYTDSSRPSYAAQSCNYMDQRLQFLYVGTSPSGVATAMRCVVIRWSDSVEADLAASVDFSPRMLDDNYSVADGSLGIWGGSNKVSAGQFEWTSLAAYGTKGTAVSTTAGVSARYVRAVVEGNFPAPAVIQPVQSVVSKDNVTFQIQSGSSHPYHMAHGKLEIQLATDAVFTVNARTVTEADANYRIYESPNGVTLATKYVSLALPDAQKLFTQHWYYRARVVNDMGKNSSYFNGQFDVSHPPAALPRSPLDSTIMQYGSGDVTFSWSFSDNEPTDVQTAYQIVLTRLDTNATVTDTGKVTSSSSSVVLNVTSTLKDIPLSYTIKLWDSDDNPGTASDPVRFTMSDLPVVVITSPTSGSTVTTGLPTISWTFTASNRTQAYYRIVVTDTDATPDVDVADTGWLAGSITSYTFPSQILENLTNYKVIVYVRDSVGLVSNSEANLVGNPGFEGGTVSGWTGASATVAASSTFKRTGSYAMAITPSAACTVTTASYPVTTGHDYTGTFWAYSVAGWTSVVVRIDWRDNTDTHLSYSDTTIAIGAASWTQFVVTATAPASATQARLVVQMTGAPTGTDILYVDDASLSHVLVNFSTAWTAPIDGDVSVVYDVFKATVSWTNANQDTDFVGWRVYRKYRAAASDDLDVDNTRNTWVLVYETTAALASYTYRDYFAPLNRPVTYAVAQVVDRFGSSIESPLSTVSTVTIAGERYYFVPAVPIGAIASFEASSVTGDSFTNEVEQATLHILGRGRQVQVGDDLGYTGTLTVKLRNPDTSRSDREFIELLSKQQNAAVYIRSPFGDVLYVKFGSTSFDRMAGVGLSDMGDLSIPYSVVFQDAVITRTV